MEMPHLRMGTCLLWMETPHLRMGTRPLRMETPLLWMETCSLQMETPLRGRSGGHTGAAPTISRVAPCLKVAGEVLADGQIQEMIAGEVLAADIPRCLSQENSSPHHKHECIVVANSSPHHKHK